MERIETARRSIKRSRRTPLGDLSARAIDRSPHRSPQIERSACAYHCVWPCDLQSSRQQNFFKLVHKWWSYNPQYNSLLFGPTLYITWTAELIFFELIYLLQNYQRFATVSCVVKEMQHRIHRIFCSKLWPLLLARGCCQIASGQHLALPVLWLL